MNKLSQDERCRVVSCLVEGNSLRATSRMTGTHRTAILKLLVELGEACAEYQDKTLVNLPCKRIQLDEIWSFVGAKEKNASPEKKKAGWGDVWTWVALDADTKLVAGWYVGSRDAIAADQFIYDLRGRLSGRVQLTSDGHKAYLHAVEQAFGCDVDFAQLIKLYGEPQSVGGEVRYSPTRYVGSKKLPIMGSPSLKHVSTSFVERQNLTMRMQMRRFTRLTNAFSKKLANHEAAISLHYMHYNFARIHQTLRVTPAMAAGVSRHVWEISEIVGLLKD